MNVSFTLWVQGTLISVKAWSFVSENCPLFDCPDKDIEKTYYYRWWVYRKHIKKQSGRFVISEFIKRAPICCPAGHHLYEGRWLGNSNILDDYVAYWFTKSEGQRSRKGKRGKLNSKFKTQNSKLTLPDLVQNYKGWEESSHVGGDLYYQYDGKDGMEKSAGGHGLRPTINSYMYGDAMAISKITNLAGNQKLADEFKAIAEGGKAKLLKLEVNELESIWKR